MNPPWVSILAFGEQVLKSFNSDPKSRSEIRRAKFAYKAERLKHRERKAQRKMKYRRWKQRRKNHRR